MLPVDILCHVSSRSCGSSVTSSRRLAGPEPHRSKDSLVIGEDDREELEPPDRDGLWLCEKSETLGDDAAFDEVAVGGVFWYTSVEL